jgi:FkbM family methyltransferase
MSMPDLEPRSSTTAARPFLFIEHHPVFGGPHNAAITLAKPLCEHGWRTIALLPNQEGSASERFREAGVEVETIELHRLRKSPRENLRTGMHFASDVRRIREVIRRRGIALVVVAGFESPHGVLAGRLEGVPVVWQMISTRLPRSYGWIMSPFARRYADIVMTTGTTVARDAGVDGMGSRWIPFLSPVDTERFAPSAERRAAARRELGLDGDGLVVGTVGNVNPQKGHRTFIRAAAALRRTRTDARFVILGEQDRNHDAYRNALLVEAERLGLTLGEDLRIESPGRRVAELAPAFDVFWCTSEPRAEGVPTAVMEAMSLGLPVVSTETGGIRDIVRDDETGFVVAPFDSDALARTTEAVLQEPGKVEALGVAGRAFAEANCRIENCTASHLQAFDAAIAHARRRRRVAAGGGDRQSPPLEGVDAPAAPAPAARVRLRRARKLARLLQVREYRAGLRFGVAAAIEHDEVPFGHDFRTVIDVGAHRGQFALFASRRFPDARIICLEPLPAAQEKLRRLLGATGNVVGVAASDSAAVRAFHVSRSSDSSSLLAITPRGVAAFPGAQEQTVISVPTARVDDVVSDTDLHRPVLLKLDVQGAELDVLHGSTRVLGQVDEALVECSFVELYEGQPLAESVVSFMKSRGFEPVGSFSVVRDLTGRSLQADLLFRRSSHTSADTRVPQSVADGSAT